MVHWLNKKFLLVFALLCMGGVAQAQDSEGLPGDKDYKDRTQFEKFYKRRTLIGAWQINQLVTGALVVRLKTDHLLIEELKKQDRFELAEKKRLELCAINGNIMRAYLSKYTFSKVYFIYSNSSDSLLKGARKNIFVDTTLAVNPDIEMREKFYLLAESDHAYNSSIGFVPEDSARMVVERGNPTSADFPIVLKNKYGHQLKKPFPYVAGKKVLLQKKSAYLTIYINGVPIPFNVGNASLPGEKKVTHAYNGKSLELYIPPIYTVEIMSLIVDQLNDNLRRYYQANPSPSENTVLFKESRPFLY